MAILIPYLNPVKFVRSNVESFFYDQQKAWISRAGYLQKFNFTDSLVCQFVLFRSDIRTAVIELVDINEIVYDFWDLTYLADAYDGAVFQWATTIGGSLSANQEGVYFLKATLEDVAGNIVFYSEPIELKTSHEDTILLTYGHDVNDYDILQYYTSGVPIKDKLFNLRITGGKLPDSDTPGGKFSIFLEQDLSPVILDGTPNITERFVFGDNKGIPPWMGDKINRIFSLNSVYVDSARYCRNDGAKLEKVYSDPRYPLMIYSMDLVKSENQFSAQYGGAATYPAGGVTFDSTAITFDSTEVTFDQT